MDGFMQNGILVTTDDFLARLDQVRQLNREKCEAFQAGDWLTAISRSESVARELRAGLAEAVNLGRTVGGMSDQEVARLRGTSRSAVAQRFGARLSLGCTTPRRPALTSEQVLYRFYDIDDVLLYVGVTGRFKDRLADHKRTQPWWLAVVVVRTERYPDRTSVEAAEKAAIASENPRHNIRR